MKHKKVDKMLNESLNSHKPTEKVLYEANAYIKNEQQYKTVQKRKKVQKWIFAIATCIIVAIVLGIYLPLFINGSHSDDKYYISSNALKIETFSSIRDYEELNEVKYYHWDDEECLIYKSKQTNDVIFIQESYTIPEEYKADSLTLNIVLEQYLSYTIQDLEIYYNLSNIYTVNDLEITYENFKDNLYYFSFTYNNNYYCIEIEADTIDFAKELINLFFE
ncbi:MAG: hypothetical protein ACOCRK_09250 [bacterium]